MNVKDEEDDFALSSSDEHELVALATAADASIESIKRKEPPKDETAELKGAALAVHVENSPLAAQILTRCFGLHAFRLKQEAVIARLLDGASAVVVFPTGRGKTLCYQIPAIAFTELDRINNVRNGPGEGGVTIVISPLIASMKDQVDALVGRGIKAACLDSTKLREESRQVSELLHQGTLKLLYCAPKRLNNEGFIEQLRLARGGIRMVAVDEAHCISEFGHSFRPDYLKISRFVKEMKVQRVICPTGTATPRVSQDICNAFDINESNLFRSSIYRSNLQLLAQSAVTKKELYPRLFRFFKEHPGPSIVYVTGQEHTEYLAGRLQSKRFKCKPYHGGMSAAQKKATQDDFMNSNILIIVATVAFGMGVNRSNVRNVVHFNVPSSLESYSQEIGRAGRDGKTSFCVFYLCGEELHLRENIARGDLPSRQSFRGLLNDIFKPDYAELAIGRKLETNHYEQERRFDLRSTILNSIYAQLELRHELIRAITPVYTKHLFVHGVRYYSEVESDKSAAAQAIKAFAKFTYENVYQIDASAAALSQGIPRIDVVQKLNKWNQIKVIDIIVDGDLSVYRVLRKLPSSSAEIDALLNDLYPFFKARELQDLTQVEKVVDLVTGSACFSRTLVQHFGDDLPGGKIECGHCTWCLEHRAVNLEKPPPIPFNHAAFQEIWRSVPIKDNPLFLTRC